MYCKGTMERKVAPYHIDRRNYHLQLDSIPAWVCTQCGEPYFEEKEVKTIQSVIQGIDAHVPFLAKSA
ncbi:MAG: YgiT-type zinc finger protein [Bacteroidota bacterium]|nr:YgiT-type zinc finger protein [Bacteroidota bacterium]